MTAFTTKSIVRAAALVAIMAPTFLVAACSPPPPEPVVVVPAPAPAPVAVRPARG